MQKNPENFEGPKWPLCKRRRHHSLLTHSCPMHITQCVFQYCLLLCSVEFQFDFPPGLPAMPGPPTGLLEGRKWIPLLVPKMIRFKFLSYCDALLTEVKGSLEASERSAMPACLLPCACLPWSLCWALGPPDWQVTGWLCSPVWSCAKLAWGVGSGWQRVLELASGSASGWPFVRGKNALEQRNLQPCLWWRRHQQPVLWLLDPHGCAQLRQWLNRFFCVFPVFCWWFLPCL